MPAANSRRHRTTPHPTVGFSRPPSTPHVGWSKRSATPPSRPARHTAHQAQTVFHERRKMRPQPNRQPTPIHAPRRVE
jgi:hypothetical protein